MDNPRPVLDIASPVPFSKFSFFCPVPNFEPVGGKDYLVAFYGFASGGTAIGDEMVNSDRSEQLGKHFRYLRLQGAVQRSLQADPVHLAEPATSFYCDVLPWGRTASSEMATAIARQLWVQFTETDGKTTWTKKVS